MDFGHTYKQVNVHCYNDVHVQDLSVNVMFMRRKGREEGEGTVVNSMYRVSDQTCRESSYNSHIQCIFVMLQNKEHS